MQAPETIVERQAILEASPQISWSPLESTQTRPPLVVVIPALDEGHTITKVISKLSSVIPQAEIVVVDGGSLDGTAEKARRAFAKVVHESERGYGKAIRSGIDSIDCDLYAIVDADDTYDLSCMPKMLELASQGKLVIGRREDAAEGGMSLSHRIGNIVLSLLCRVLFRLNVSDTQSGFKVFPGEIARALRQDGMSLSSEILLVGHHMGYEVTEVPVNYYLRNDDSKSKFGFWKDGVSVLLFLISSRIKRFPTILPQRGASFSTDKFSQDRTGLRKDQARQSDLRS